MAASFDTAIQTCLALSEQFRTGLKQGNLTSPDANTSSPSPLPLLRASSAALKSQVTKLSLLAINTPFSQSAVASVVSVINDSVLPSLATAATLITPKNFSTPYSTEVNHQASETFHSLTELLHKVVKISQDNAGKLSKQREQDLTTSTGQVWSGCDSLVDLSDRGTFGFLIQKLEGYRDLVQDAIGELEEWDPEAHEDDGFGEDLGVHEGSESQANDSESDDGEANTAALTGFKESALKVAKAVAQIYPAIKVTRLKKSAPVALNAEHVKRIDTLFHDHLSKLPELVDEMSGLLYEHDLPGAQAQLGQTKVCAAEAVKMMLPPWEGSNAANDGDRFDSWGKTWLRINEAKPVEAESTDDSKAS